MPRTRGFTLIELMVTIAILAILLSIAVPGFQAFVQNSRATTLANQLTTAINLARSEAIRRGAVVSVCSDNWANGWRVELGTDCNAAGDDMLRVWDAPPPRSVIDAGGESSVGFEATGARENLGGGEVAFNVHVENCSGPRARILRVSPSGRVAVERTACP